MRFIPGLSVCVSRITFKLFVVAEYVRLINDQVVRGIVVPMSAV